jgi:hypothetical protein
MTDEYFNVRFIFTPKNREASHALKAVVEVPTQLVQRTRESMNSNVRESGIALDLARSVAKAMLSGGTESDVWLFDEDALWYTDPVS